MLQTSPTNKTSPAKTTSPSATTPRTPTRKTKPSAAKTEGEPSPKTPRNDKSPVQKLTTTGKLKRQRTRTQPYQSPLPELEIISKMSSTPNRNNDEKLIVFYK